MKVKLFQERYEEIEVPQEDVRQAIRKGIQKANVNYTPSKRFGSGWKLILSVAAAIILIASSFMISPVSQVLANVPLVGNLYSHFNDLVGRSLESQQLITKLNETTSYKGMDVTITSAYYDGGVIGVTFDLSGDIKEDEKGQYSAFYEIFGGESSISDSKEIVYLNSTDSGFSGYIQHYYPKSDLPEQATVPIEFKRVGEEEGIWKFDVPIEQLPFEVIQLEESRFNEDKNVRITFDSVIVGEASTTLNYTAAFLKSEENNQVRLEVYDDQGSRIDGLIDGIDLDKIQQDKNVLVKGRTIIKESLKGKTRYIEIQPKVALIGEDPNKPIELESVRINLPD